MNSLTKVLVQCRRPNSSLRILGITFINRSLTSAAEDIVIPKRIHRSPTDILKALNETIKVDPSAPHYKYQDDPYLTPVSSPEKRTFALAHEAGRKAARWVRDQHPELFQQIIATPAIEAYKPKEKITDTTPVSETLLTDLIEQVRVTDAIKAFNLLQQNGESISPDTLQSLLELVCYYNGADATPEEDVEERWLSKQDKTRSLNTWNGAVTETIFHAIEAPTSASYSAIICGMLRYGENMRAHELLNKCRSERVPLDVKVYNYLIYSTNLTYGKFEKRWEVICEYLKMMVDDKVAPNQSTFNSVLQAVHATSLSETKIECTFKVLGEMRALGIKPTLGTYKELIDIVQSARISSVPLLSDILDEVAKEPLEMVEASDSRFFVQAMAACNILYKDPSLARRLDDLLNKASAQQSFIGSSHIESVYYRHYFLLLCDAAPLDQLWSTYKTLVPNIYSPEVAVVSRMLLVMKTENRPDYIVQLWKYIVASRQTNQQQLVEAASHVLVIVGATEQGRAYAKQFAQIIDDVMENLVSPSMHNISGRLRLTTELAARAMVLYARDGRMADVKTLIDLYQTSTLAVDQNIESRDLKELADIAVEKMDYDVVLWVLQCSADDHHHIILAKDVIAKLCRKTALPPQTSRALAMIVGEQTLKEIIDKNPVGLPEDSVSSGSSASSSSSSSDSEDDDDDDSASDDELGIKK